VEGPTDWLIATKGKRDVGYPSRHFAPWADVLEHARRAEELYTIIVVLREASAHREDVGVEDDVLWIEAYLEKIKHRGEVVLSLSCSSYFPSHPKY
jgi:hypothetical protein